MESPGSVLQHLCYGLYERTVVLTTSFYDAIGYLLYQPTSITPFGLEHLHILCVESTVEAWKVSTRNNHLSVGHLPIRLEIRGLA